MGAPHSGNWAAAFYSLLRGCLRRGLNPRDSLRGPFTKLPTATIHTVGSLTPAPSAALRPKATGTIAVA